MDLYAALEATWPPVRVERVAGFRLRDGEGGGRRTSSAVAERPDADPAEAIAALRARGRRPVFMIRDGEAELDRRLAELGCIREAETVLYAAPAAAITRPARGMAVIGCEAPVAILAELWLAGGIGPARLAVMARAADPKRYLLGRLDDRPAGAAFVSVAGSVAVLSALFVSGSARRRGLGRRLAEAAAAFAAAQGAETFALAVEAENAPARALYETLDMTVAGRYGYRSLPEEPR